MVIGLVGVLVLAFFLLVATFTIGWLPTQYLSRGVASTNRWIGILSRFGVGMLLGTSFTLVIPEGVDACLQHNGNVGINLLIGFMVVYMLDRVVQMVMGASIGVEVLPDGNRELESFKDVLRNPKRVVLAVLKNNVVFALVIHGLSDGIALGTTTNNESLLIVVLIAIIIHKIPAVLSLTSIMISKQRLPRWEVLSNLFVFASSTPLGYIVVSVFNLKHSEAMDWIGGNLLLMSGGSLLYASFTAFTGGDSHDMQLEETVEGGYLREGSAFVLVDANQPPVNDTCAKNVTVMTPSTSKMAPEMSPPQELMYVLLGVAVPTLISFVISD
ncbi:hypothetical protein HG537_0G02320 [Torulaspora globosa]|uniref:Zinc/iron permease n=1 Tax=Torulaspora globosa TaxID=48254 RepID=A0A7H9HW97_9SACH|nr:hypothetical protein HG537_0G02320 [Torulaspora sp. CBS 2947]